MANFTLTPEVRSVLERSTITATSVILPHQLDRKLYEAVNKVLNFAGGKWNRFAGAHLFESDPRIKLGLTLETGVAVDEQKLFQYFPTPPALAAQVAELADVAGQLVLEPSAGDGALVKACLAEAAKSTMCHVHCVELNPEHRTTLEKLSPKVLIGDFLEHLPEPGGRRYSRIVMNPPFGGPTGRDQDIAHVEHALKWLAPGGVLVAIMLDNIGRPKFQALTGRLDELAIASESEDSIYRFVKVPANTFADTPIRTIILQIKLPEGTSASGSPARSKQAVKAAPSVPVVPSVPATPPVAAPPSTETKLSNAMKLTIPRNELAAALGAVKTVAGANSTYPILANVLLVAEKSTLTLTASDLDISLRLKTAASVIEPGSVTVRAQLLHEIARNTSSDDVTLRLEPGRGSTNATLHVECGTVKFQLATVAAGEFPPTPSIVDGTDFTLGEAALHTMFNRTVFATSTDANRFIFNSTLMQLNGKLNVAACDGRRLGLMTAETLEHDKLSLVVPARTVRELLRLLDPANEESEVQITASSNMIRFIFGDHDRVTLISKLIEGEYPDYTRIIPKSDVAVASIPRVALLRAVELVALVADGVKLDFRQQSVAVQSTHVASDKPDLFGNATDSLLCPCTRALTIKLHAAYLADALRATRSDVVEFYADGPADAPATIAMLKSPDEHWLAVIAAMSDEPKPAKPQAK